MKIAIICSSFFPVIDGVTIAVFNRLKQLSLWGHQVIVFCPDYQAIESIYPNYQEYRGEIFPGVKIINLPSTKSLALDFERDVTPAAYQTVVRELDKFRPDIIHIDEAERLALCFLKLPGVKYARQNNIPCVAWFHTNYIDYVDDYFDFPAGINYIIKKILGLIFAKIYNYYDRTLVSSKVTAKKLTKLGIKNIVYADLLGYDVAQFMQPKNPQYFQEQYNLPPLENKLKLIFIGRLTPDKGWDFTLKALAQLPAEILSQIAIIIAGDGSLKTTIEQQLQQLTADVYLLGRISPLTVAKLLINGDLAISNSEKETRGLTIIELEPLK